MYRIPRTPDTGLPVWLRGPFRSIFRVTATPAYGCDQAGWGNLDLFSNFGVLQVKPGVAVLTVVLLYSLILPGLLARQKPVPSTPPQSETDWVQQLNGRLQQLNGEENVKADYDYRIGPQDLLDINIFEAPELNHSLRVSANGEISMPLIGSVNAMGLTAKELENSIQSKLLRYIKDPHVSVLVTSIESHPISVIGEVNKPGVFQVREPKSLLEVLSLGQGLSPDAGDEVLVIRGGATESTGAGFMQVDSPGKMQGIAAPQSDAQPQSQATGNTTYVKLEDLLASGDPRFNLAVNPGDVVEVTKAGIVYVVGSVKRPGGFVMKNSESLSVLQAIALAEGLTDTSAKSRARIIRSDEKSGKRTEIPINLAKILSGKAPDEVLKPADIVFIPDSTAKGAFYRGMGAAVTTASGVAVWRF